MENLRQEKGKQIAQTKQIQKITNGWLVPSQTSSKKYIVTKLFECNCPDYETRKDFCKHAYAVQYYLKETITTPQGTITKETKITYSQDWVNYNKAQTSEVNLFDGLLKDLVQNINEPAYTFGRPKLSLKETVFCAVQKVYSQLSSRRAHSLYKNAVEREQLSKAPHFNAVSKLLNRTELTPILHELISITAKPLRAVETDFAVDSSGFRTRCFGQYAEQKYELKRQHRWVKVHLASGVKTNIVTSAKITEEHSADSPQFAELVKQTAETFTVKEVLADKGYSSRDNYETVADIGGQAYIPFKKNTTGKARGSMLWSKMYHYFEYNRDEFMQHYHKRSNAETVFSSIKKKFGETIKSKNQTAQVNEMLCKIVAYNITVLIQEMFVLGIKAEF